MGGGGGGCISKADLSFDVLGNVVGFVAITVTIICC